MHVFLTFIADLATPFANAFKKILIPEYIKSHCVGQALLLY